MSEWFGISDIWTPCTAEISSNLARGLVIGDGNLIEKIYFPRLILPLARPLSALVDFGIGTLILLGLMGFGAQRSP